jgi:Flp pilus assembly protein protease CpaA
MTASATVHGRIHHPAWALHAIALVAPAVGLWLMSAAIGIAGASAAGVIIVGGAIIWRDIRTRTIPNRWVLTLALVGLAMCGASAVADNRPDLFLTGAIAAAATFAGYFAFGLVGWVGYGDAKLAASLALVASVTAGASALLILPCAILLGGVQRVVCARLVRNQSSRPHAPALVAAALILLIASC